MTDLNTLNLIGRVTKDAELAYTSGGLAKLETGIAVNRSKKNGDKWEEETSFFNITLWGKTAENLKPYIHKGQQIAVSGHLEQQRWKDKNGNNQSKVAIVTENVQLIGGNPRQGAAPTEYQGQNQGDFPEDIPF